jgi:Type IIA topoisomerase (DNA gyrase/topo II, topoisomerase IV), B subunit
VHVVGVSVINALSSRLEVRVKRDGIEHMMAFAGGETVTPLTEVGSVGKRNTGTAIAFWPDARFFDSTKIAVPRLKHLLRAKAVLCPGLTVTLVDEAADERLTWCYEDGLSDYLATEMAGAELVPAEAIIGRRSGQEEAVEWALQWRIDDGEPLAESYVNLVPTREGGTQVSGLRQGVLEAFREFCDFRNLLPRGVKLAAEDVMDGCAYLLSLKMSDPQFAGQTKERLSSRSATPFVSGAVRDALALWLNQHPETASHKN